MSQQQSRQPGWYRDSAGSTRWWDGMAWTTFVPPAEGTAVVLTEHAAPTTLASAGVEGDVLPRRETVTSRSLSARRPAPSRNPRGAARLIMVGAAFLAACAFTFALAAPHGGIVWAGAGIVGAALILRGIGELAEDGSGTRRRLQSAATQLADPWAAHHAAKARQNPGRGSAAVPTWVVVLCLGTPVAVVVAVLLTGYVRPSPAGTASVAAPSSAGKPTVDAKATPTPVGPYVPNTTDSWRPIGTNAAYAELGMGPSDCLPGTLCAIVKIASRKSCATLVVHVVFLDSNHARSTSSTITLTRVRAGHSVRTRLTTRDSYAWDYDITSARCT